MIRVMIVEDHQLVRKGLEYALKDARGIKVVGEAESGEEAIKQVKVCKPDIILMDFNLPGMDGLEATWRIKRTLAKVKTIILTVGTHDLITARLLEAGALGYLTKSCTSDELIMAIKVIAKGQIYITPGIATKLAIARIKPEDLSIFNHLSDRELQTMLMIVQGISTEKIADSLHINRKTVNSYRYRIFSKLRVKNDVELTLLALKDGFIESEKA